MRKPSLYKPREEGCWICGNPNVEEHHIYFGVGRRQISDREGCYIYLCHNHHQHPMFGIHFDKELDKAIKEDCQRRWMKANDATVNDFIATFGRNYL